MAVPVICWNLSQIESVLCNWTCHKFLASKVNLFTSSRVNYSLLPTSWRMHRTWGDKSKVWWNANVLTRSQVRFPSGPGQFPNFPTLCIRLLYVRGRRGTLGKCVNRHEANGENQGKIFFRCCLYRQIPDMYTCHKGASIKYVRTEGRRGSELPDFVDGQYW